VGLPNQLSFPPNKRPVITFSAPLLILLAQTSSGDGQVRELVAYELGRLAKFDDPRVLWAVVGTTFVLLASFVTWFYYRERDTLRGPWRVLLASLRIVALAALVLYFLNLEKRIDQQIVTESQVVVLVDTSLSMSVEDATSPQQTNISRSEAVGQLLVESPLLATLQQEHNVVLAVFDKQLTRVTRWERASAQEDPTKTPTTRWVDLLQPRGAETRLGEALRNVLQEENEGPLAGVIVFSDGGHNSGAAPLKIADKAGERQTPFYMVGVGSTAPRRNLRVLELNAPSHVYPDDKATVHCLIHGEGFVGRTVDVELTAREAGVAGAQGDRIGKEQITFHEEGEVVSLKFDFEPVEVGRLALEVRIVAPPDDQYAADNRREVEVEVVETESRILLIASGAARDYRFLRNQLRRDPHMRVDVWLQLAKPGISQDADKMLHRFPETKADLYTYDCIVAFDPDWTLLDARQVEMLQSWVAEEAGGLVVIAGPIHTATWVQSPEHVGIRALYPVEFQRRLTRLDDGLYGSKTPWPLEFSRAGEESDFLWLGDSANESRSSWAQFAGVFGCYAVQGPKPGARVLARYSDPDAGLSVARPVYLAEHFYGAGRVLYLGSSELWRLRSLGVKYFEVLYTQILRHVSQGRLRGSSLGRLLLQRDRYSVGDEVIVRAKLSTESREPLITQQVTARLIGPDGNGQNLKMAAEEDRPGNFVGQFSARQEGSYRIELPVPDVLDEQLVRRLQVVAPNLEFDRTRRDESLLAALANRSGGRYYGSLQTAVEGNNNLRPVAEWLDSRAETRILRGRPDHDFTEWLNRILLGVICGSLCLEWLLRRLMRLA